MEKLKDGMQPSVLWTDKMLFTVQAIHNHQNYRIYAVNKEDIPMNERIAYKRQKPACVMVWAGVTSTGEKAPLIFIEEWVKINQHVYVFLKEQLVPWINAISKESGITLQQDGATFHTANLVQEWGNRNMAGFGTRELWPPSSPDFNPMDFAVWNILESNACSSYPQVLRH